MSMSPYNKGDPDEDWYNLQIEQELEKIDLEDDQGEDNFVEGDAEPGENHNQEGNLDDTVSEALECYLRRMTEQSHQLELELEGIDELIQHKHTDSSTDCLALVPTSEVEILQQAAAEQGLDPETYRKQILLELDNEEDDAFSLEEEEPISNRGDVGGAGDDGQVGVLMTEESPAVSEPVLPGEEGDSSDQGENDLNAESGAVVLADPTMQFREFLKGQWAVRTEKQKQRDAFEREKTEVERIQREKLEIELESKRQHNIKEFQDKERKLAELMSTKTADLERELAEKNKTTEFEWKKIEHSIEQLERQNQKEREELIHQKAQESEKHERQHQKSALKLQSVYRGYRVRKVHGPLLKEKSAERRKLTELKKIKAKEVELAQLENIKKEEARKRQTEANQISELKKAEDEKKEKEAEEQRRKAERLLKEEQEKMLKEENERKQREEEEQRKKAEERRKYEETEQKRIEAEAEQKRVMEEAEQKKKAEEAEQKKKAEEAEQKKKAEEAEQKKKAEEAERKRKAEEVEQKRKAEEAEKQRKIEEAAIKAAKKRAEEEKLKASTEAEAEEKKNEGKAVEQVEERKLHEVTEKGTGTQDKGYANVNIASASSPLLTASLPSEMEERRRKWMSNCSPWSKLSTEPWKKKSTEKRKSAKRPSSAKKLPPLDSKVLLGSASSLQEVSTVKLSELPGSSLSTLSQCVHLRHLEMTHCGLKAVDGLSSCQTLQYVNLQNNELQYVDLNDLAHLEYVNLSSNQLSVLHGLERCPNLRWLDMSHNKLIKIGWLCGLRQLHSLDLSDNQLMSTQGVGEAPTLQHLNLSNNHIQTLDDIHTLCLLQTLVLTGNTILQIPSLLNQVLLQELYLDDNSIASLDNLRSAWLPCLRKLNLCQNSLSELGDLSSCLLLRDLDVSNNQLLDGEELADNLKQCVHLNSVNVDGNPGAEEFRCAAVHLSSLRTIDEHKLDRSEQSTTVTPRCSFEAMCLTHCQRVDELNHGLQQSLCNKADNNSNLEMIHKAYFHYCRKSFDLAVENRYAHEYGEVTVNWPSAPAGPKPTARPCSGRVKGRMAEKQPSTAAKQDICETNNSMGIHFDQQVKLSRPDEKGDDPEINTLNGEVTLPTLSENLHSIESVQNNSEITGNSFTICAEVDNTEILDDVNPISDTEGRRKEDTIAMSSQTKNLSLTMDNQNNQTFVNPEVVANDANSVNGVSTSCLKWNSSPDGSSHYEKSEWTPLDGAATIIQATWRGYNLRSRLLQALEYARFSDEEEDEEEFKEVNLGDFNFDMADLDDEWKPPPTPKIPSSYPVVGKPPSGRPGSETGTHHPPVFPRQAWRNLTSPLTQRASPTGHLPRPPSSALSGTDTHRTGLSKKEEMLSEEWGFKDTRTAELMFARAKKMKYNSDKRKKLNKLDPKQKLALFKKLSESTRMIKPVQPLSRKTLPRKEYFQARAREVEEKEREKRTEVVTKTSRTFEWLHTQVAVGEFSSSGMSNLLTRNESESSLPRLDDDITAGRRVQLVGSPLLLEVESVTSAEDTARQRRLSLDDSSASLGVKSVPLQLPPIKTNSAPTSKVRERMSWRTAQKNTDVGWGGGRRRRSKPI